MRSAESPRLCSPKELSFLEGLRFTTRQPTALYFHGELQSLRDPLHFRPLPRVSR